MVRDLSLRVMPVINNNFTLHIVIIPAPSKAEKDAPTTCKKPESSIMLPWTVHCRLSLDGMRDGPISGSLRINPGSSPSYKGRVPTRASLATGSQWTSANNATHFGLHINFDKIDRSVLTGRVEHTGEEVQNVTLEFVGTQVTTGCVGHVSPLSTPPEGEKKEQPADVGENGQVRFNLIWNTGPFARCAKCMSFAQDIGFYPELTPSEPQNWVKCPKGCGTKYCSDRCMDAHASIHSASCSAVASYIAPTYSGGPERHPICATFTGVEFVVYWKPTAQASYSILVDTGNPLGRAFEMHVSLFQDAKHGENITVLGSASPPKYEELVPVCMSVYLFLFSHAADTDQLALAAICLNHLHTWCEYHEHIARQYAFFYEMTADNTRTISSPAEYTSNVRPLYEYATVLVESAFKSTLSYDFWVKLDTAKEVLISLYNFNSAVTFTGTTPAMQQLRDTIVPAQQRQTLMLLAKVFIISATRLSPQRCERMLRRAEECYKDAIDEDKARGDKRGMGECCLELSCLYLMFSRPQDIANAAVLRANGFALLKEAASAQQQATAAAQPK